MPPDLPDDALPDASEPAPAARATRGGLSMRASQLRVARETLVEENLTLRHRAKAAIVTAETLYAAHKRLWLRHYGGATGEGGAILVRRCAWCRRLQMATSHRWHRPPRWDLDTVPGVSLSHGMCPDCAAEFFEPGS